MKLLASVSFLLYFFSEMYLTHSHLLCYKIMDILMINGVFMCLHACTKTLAFRQLRENEMYIKFPL